MAICQARYPAARAPRTAGAQSGDSSLPLIRGGRTMTRAGFMMARADLDRLQELLGYNIYPPFVGYVDGRHPRRVLSAG